MPWQGNHRKRKEREISDEDRDSLHILPLGLIEIQSQAIKRARLIKNANLETVIEMFDNRQTGSGQIELPGLAREMGWVSPPHPDLMLLRKLVASPELRRL